MSSQLVIIRVRSSDISLEQKIKRPTQKTEFFNTANSQYFFEKNSGIGPWVSRTN